MNPNLRRRLKYVAPLVVKKVSFENLDRKYVGLEHIESWTGRILYDDLTTLPEGTVSLFEPNDVLFGKLRPYLAKVSLVDFSGACSTEALVLRPKTNQWPPFVRYVLSNGEFIDDVNSSTFGAKMPRASWEFIGSRTVPVPDLPTQKAIADFLDRETARIDQLIEWKQRMVEVLEEKRIAAITDLFCGVRAAGCKSFRLRYLLSQPLKYGANEAADSDDPNDVRFIRITDFRSDGTLREETFKSLPIEKAQEYLLEEGDILFARSGANLLVRHSFMRKRALVLAVSQDI